MIFLYKTKTIKGVYTLEDNTIVRLANRMDQLPPYLFGMINKMKMDN